MSHAGPRPMGGVPSVGVFLRDPRQYLHEIRKKPRKTPNGYVDKHDRGLNLAPPVFQFWALPLCHWWSEIQLSTHLTIFSRKHSRTFKLIACLHFQYVFLLFATNKSQILSSYAGLFKMFLNIPKCDAKFCDKLPFWKIFTMARNKAKNFYVMLNSYIF